jgi:hypothetical protein
MVAVPDNRRDKADRDSKFCKGSHDASILSEWGITLGYTHPVSLRRKVHCAGDCAGLGETCTGFGADGSDGGAETF